MHCIQDVVVFFIYYKLSFHEQYTVTSSEGYVVEDLKGLLYHMSLLCSCSSAGVSCCL